MAIVTASTVGHLEALPRWARELSEKYYSRNIAMFVLYGNVFVSTVLRCSSAAKPSSGSATSS